MTSETPVSLKREKKNDLKSDERQCIIHYENVSRKETVREFTDISWKKVLDTKIKRLNSNDPTVRQGSLCEDIPQVLDQTLHGYHRQCYKRLTVFDSYQLKRQAEAQNTTVLRKKKKSIN